MARLQYLSVQVLALLALHASLTETLSVTRFGKTASRLEFDDNTSGQLASQRTVSETEPASKAKLLAQLAGIARGEAEALKNGVDFLRNEASIIKDAALEGLIGSTSKLKDGDFNGAVSAANFAASNAELRIVALGEEAPRSASNGVCMLLTIVFIATCWCLEALLERCYDLPKEACQMLDSKQEEQGNAPHLDALSFARYVLSWMVVLYNYYPWSSLDGIPVQSADPLKLLAGWSALTIPLFFLLSGFCHSYSKLTGPSADNDENTMGAVTKRVMVWYPFYVLVLVFCSLRYISYNAEDWSHFLASIFLFQGIFWGNQLHYPYFAQGWWLCYLSIYLFVWGPMHSVLSKCSNSVLWTMFVMTTLLVFPSVIFEDWCFPGNNLWYVMQYLPTFIFGQTLAAWFVTQCLRLKVPASAASPIKPYLILVPINELGFTVRYGVTMSVLLVGILMSSVDLYGLILNMEVYPLLMKGLLLPIFGMFVAGLAGNADPMSKLFSRPLLSWTGNLALSNFFLQQPIHMLLKDSTGLTGISFAFAFVLSLSAASVLGYFCIEKPSRAAAKTI